MGLGLSTLPINCRSAWRPAIGVATQIRWYHLPFDAALGGNVTDELRSDLGSVKSVGLSCLGMSASPATPDVSLRGSRTDVPIAQYRALTARDLNAEFSRGKRTQTMSSRSLGTCGWNSSQSIRATLSASIPLSRHLSVSSPSGGLRGDALDRAGRHTHHSPCGTTHGFVRNEDDGGPRGGAHKQDRASGRLSGRALGRALDAARGG